MKKTTPISHKNADERLSRGKTKESGLFPISPSNLDLPNRYLSFLSKLKERIHKERLRVILSSNSKLILLYWDIGKMILSRQEKEGWGAKIIDRLSYDLKQEFPDMKGFSPRNLKYMRAFTSAFPNRKIVQGWLAQISWYHNLALLDKLDNAEIRLWYAKKAIENGWSRDILVFQIEAQLYTREGKAISNFSKTLPPPESDMAVQIFKDPYVFDFLGTSDPRREKELEQTLIDHIQKFLLELGTGFAFVGRQVLLEIGKKDYYLDLLFYHLKLRCYVVVELKTTSFKPEYVGKLNMYLAAVDDLLSHPDDKPSIGLLLGKEKDKLLVEYALNGFQKPIGVADWERSVTQSLPDILKSSLPTVEEIEAELGENSV